jgi:glycosyltransferase involved in cell wall biosynthesis
MHAPATGEIRAPAERAVTVIAVPAGHPYVQRVSAAPGVTVLPDPPVAGRGAGQWWPPAALDPHWIRRHADEADLLHVHFGTESFPPGHLTACIDAAHDAGWAVVYTAHDLEHPQLSEQGAHDAQLGELFRGADAVVTLTPGAAATVRTRWHRDAVVIPHPSLLRPDGAATPVPGSEDVRTDSEDVRIGVHLKDLRPNVDGPGTVAALLAAVDRLRAEGIRAVAEVRLHHRVRDEAARDEVRRLCAASDSAFLLEHERLSDLDLEAALGRLDACVLPYRHGTHSGWLELCWDLGVPVAAPAVGFYVEQHPDPSVAGFSPADAESLGDALAHLLGPAGTRPASPGRRALVAERAKLRARSDSGVAAAHAALYRQLIQERAA